MYITRQQSQPPLLGRYALVAALGFAATILGECAVSFYRAAQAVAPSKEQVGRSLETLLSWHDAAGHQIEQVDTILQQQAYDVARESLQDSYLFQSAATFIAAVACVCVAASVAIHKKRE